MDLKKRYLLLNNTKYHFSDLQASYYNLENKSPFEIATLKFCTDWLQGKEIFTLKTSGSTGIPKKIFISADQMKISAAMTLKAFKLKKNDPAFVCLNTEYIAGMMMLVRGIEGRMQMIIKEPNSNPFLDLEKNIKIDFTALVPLQLQYSLENPESFEIIKNIKNIIVGGAPVSSYLEGLLQNLKNNIFQTYGMTETVSHIALRKLTGTIKNEYYTTLDGINIDKDSRDCLKIHGPVTNNKWVTTNDIVTLLDINKFIWRGRIDQVINSGGFKFTIVELEQHIMEIFQTLNIGRRFFIIGKPNKILGEEISLIIEGAADQKLISILNSAFYENLKKYEIPKIINFVNSFIESPTGKILRYETSLLVNEK